MADIVRAKSDRAISQAGVVVGVNRVSGEIIKIPPSGLIVSQPAVGDIDTLYDNRFDDYGLRRKTVEIGDWNMDSTLTLEVAHGLGSNNLWKNIRSSEVTIRNDADDTYYDDSMEGDHIAVSGIDTTNVVLTRTAATASPSGVFDHPNFDSTSYNRGWVTVWYE